MKIMKTEPNPASLTKFTVTLRIGRKLLIVLLAVAIAALPASVRFANAALSAPAAATAVQVVPDFEHHHHHGAPSGQTQKPANNGVCPAGCPICFDFVATDVVTLNYALSFATALKPARAISNISSLMGNPPFRPPRS